MNLRITTCDTQGNKPAIGEGLRGRLLGQGADVDLHDLRRRLRRARSCRSRSTRGKLTIAPCIGTDQMGPKRFGAKGRLAFSYGNVAQDEGSAMAEYAWRRGWRTRRWRPTR